MRGVPRSRSSAASYVYKRQRNLLERQQIGKYVVRNVDLIRQARQRRMKATGQQRKRNHVEQLFDKVAADDPTIDKVDMVGDQRFLSLTQEEKTKAAESFATNTHACVVNLNTCQSDDEFCKAFGASLETNKSIEKLNLESNNISGDGIKALSFKDWRTTRALKNYGCTSNPK